MSTNESLAPFHPAGEQPAIAAMPSEAERTVDTFGGPVRVAWDGDGAVTPFGQMPFFAEYLKVSGLFETWVGDCPLRYTSPNAPAVRDVLGTLMLSVLAGHKRYAHIAALRGDDVLPGLLGMEKIVSEDSARRSFKAVDERDGLAWLQCHIERCTSPLLAEPYILDIDTTVKVLYGHQQGAVVSYNPNKKGRPSHVHHTYMMAGLRLVLGMETAPGNEHRSSHATPGLWALLDRLGRDLWPRLLRGDAGFGSENVMREAELRGIDHMLKLRLTKNVKSLINRAFSQRRWQDAGQGWQGQSAELRLVGWSRPRRVVVLRRRLKDGVVAERLGADGELQLSFAEIDADVKAYEHAVLATSLDADIVTIAQLYRDRADCENAFDELKNQWGWGGYSTQNLARCRITASMVALVYNWWNLFVRLAEPDKHHEAITSRPWLLAAIGERTTHARQTTLRVTSLHGRAGLAQRVLGAVATFLGGLSETAEQLTVDEKLRRILSHAARAWLKGRQLRLPPRLTAPA